MVDETRAGEIMEVEDIQEFLHIGKRLAYELCRGDQIPCFKVGGRVLTSRSALTDWAYQQALEAIGVHIDLGDMSRPSERTPADFFHYLRQASGQ